MLNPKIKVLQSTIEGKGLIAQHRINKDEWVWKLDENEKKLTKEELMELPADIQKLAYQAGDRFIVLTDQSEYINHSCDPNVWWEGDTMFVALRDILPGEEVTYDYATSDIDPDSLPDFECHCGSKSCRGTVTHLDCLDTKFQEKYTGHLPSWVLEFIHSKDDATV